MEEKKVKISKENALYLIDKLQYILDVRLHGEGSDVVINEFKELLDMEEKKLNLKPFDLQAAKSGKPVCTRDGRKARIICFDQKDIAPIVGLVTGLDGKESIYAFYKDGRVSSQEERVDDLMMLPEKKEGWIVVRRSDIYENEEEAREALLDSYGAMMIKKITWEE